MPGFRPGKVPTNLVRKMHGEALAQDALNSSIQEGVQQLLSEHKLRPAMQPSVSLEGDYEPARTPRSRSSWKCSPTCRRRRSTG
jgi:trigger factor